MKPLLLLLLVIGNVGALKYAYISTLSTDDFLLPAKVVAHRIRTLNESIPFVILATEDISNSTIEVLESRNVVVLQTKKIDSPFLESHKGAKYQYTKIRLWSLTDFDVLVYIDLDTLPVSDPSAAFRCGSFCASFRHSDMFNAGVFVLRPNLTVYKNLLDQTGALGSYDGGDQGFLNAYFSDLKYAPMMRDEGAEDGGNQLMRISAAFNYDIGMYYMNGGRMLLKPKIIHYTLGPTKPWIWWTYPLFDLNQEWLNARVSMESFYDEPDPDRYLFILGLILTLVSLLIREALMFLTRKSPRSDVVSPGEYKHLPYIFVALAVFFAFQITPNGCHPVATWIFFSTCLVGMALFLSDLYTSLRLGRSEGFVQLLCCGALTLSLIGSSWTFLAMVPSFGLRAILTIPIGLANLFFLVRVIKMIVFGYPALYCSGRFLERREPSEMNRPLTASFFSTGWPRQKPMCC